MFLRVRNTADAAAEIREGCPRLRSGEQIPTIAQNATWYRKQICDLSCIHLSPRGALPPLCTADCEQSDGSAPPMPCVLHNANFRVDSVEAIVKVYNPELGRGQR